jgi:hypothetical protein
MATTTRVFQVQLRQQSIRIARRYAAEILEEMQDAAQINALGGEYSTGRLASSVYKSGPFPQGSTVTGSIGSRLEYASHVERGARVHNIFPKGAPKVYRFGAKRRPMLKFVWRGRVVYMNQIPGGPGTIGRSHPGMKGKHWLSKAIAAVGARHRLRVIIYDL